MTITDSGNIGFNMYQPNHRFMVPYLNSVSSGGWLRYDSSDGTIAFTSSSIRYKENVKPFFTDFYEILQLQPKAYIYKGDNREGVGYVAEDIDKLGLKELVSYNQKGQPEAINYDVLQLYIVEIIKSQQQRIETLEKEIKELKDNR